MSAQEITRIATDLAATAITPSHPVPMAELLKVLSQWKQQPASASEAGSTAQMTPAPAAEPTLLQLVERLERLEQKVDRLTELLLQQGKQ